MPGNSSGFDCDDGALLMYDRLSSVGIESVVMAGNLKLLGEEFKEIDHVWLLAELGSWEIAFDWGMPKFDGQHYEGYPVSHTQLTEWVEHDHLEQQIASREGGVG